MCVLEFPDLERDIHAAYVDDGVTVIGVNTGGLAGGDDAARIQSFIEQANVTFPVVMDRGQTVTYASGLGISPFPTDLVIDRDGVIRYLRTEYDPDALREAVLSAL